MPFKMCNILSNHLRIISLIYIYHYKYLNFDNCCFMGQVLENSLSTEKKKISKDLITFEKI